MTKDLSVSFDFVCEKHLGPVNDPVTPQQIKWLKKRCNGLINEAEKINKSKSALGFLCLMALIAYFGELVYGDVVASVDPKDRDTLTKKNKKFFCEFMNVEMSKAGRKYTSVSEHVYNQVRNGLAHCLMLFSKGAEIKRIALSHNVAYSATPKAGKASQWFKTEKLSDGKTVVTVLCASDLIQDMRAAISGLFNDKVMAERMVEYSRTHFPIIGINE